MNALKRIDTVAEEVKINVIKPAIDRAYLEGYADSFDKIEKNTDETADLIKGYLDDLYWCGYFDAKKKYEHKEEKPTTYNGRVVNIDNQDIWNFLNYFD